MHIACWIPKATNTHSWYVILFVFHSNNGYANAPQCNVIRTLPFLLCYAYLMTYSLISLYFTNDVILSLIRNNTSVKMLSCFELYRITCQYDVILFTGAVGGDDDSDDKEKEEEAERERQEAIREAEERRKEKHRKMEEEREKMRQEIRDKVREFNSEIYCQAALRRVSFV